MASNVADSGDGQISPDQEASDMLQKYLNEGDECLQILVAGKMGVGKSSLVNSIYGAKIAKEDNSAAAVTRKILNFTANVPTPSNNNGSKDSTIRVWDSPGFGDVFATNTEEIIQELIFVVDKAHVILYCFDIRGRLSNDDCEGLIEITKRVHPIIWKNAVFVLTFCNELKPPPNSDTDPVQFFKKSFESWREQITRVLQVKAGVPDVVNSISVVACGYRDTQPPGYKNWYTTFWSCVFEKMRETGQPMLLKLTFDRLVNNRSPDISEPEPPSPTADQNPYAKLKVNLYGEKEIPGSVAGETPVVGSKIPIVSGARLSPVLPAVRSGNATRKSEGIEGSPSSVQAAATQNSTRNSDAKATDPTAREPPPDPPARQPSPDPPARQPPAREQDNINQRTDPPARQPPDPPARQQESRKGAFMKCAGGITGSTVAGAIIGALVGIIGGPVGIAAGVVAGAAVGGSIGVIGVIVLSIMKFFRKKQGRAIGP